MQDVFCIVIGTNLDFTYSHSVSRANGHWENLMNMRSLVFHIWALPFFSKFKSELQNSNSELDFFKGL